jgi:hypothetical protein
LFNKLLADYASGLIQIEDIDLLQVVFRANNQIFEDNYVLSCLSLKDIKELLQDMLSISIDRPLIKQKQDKLTLWKPNIDKYIAVFQREYSVSKEDALLKYTWGEVSQYVSLLPIEKVITIYEGKKAKNSERYLEALCDRDIKSAEINIKDAELEFERRKNLRKGGNI